MPSKFVAFFLMGSAMASPRPPASSVGTPPHPQISPIPKHYGSGSVGFRAFDGPLSEIERAVRAKITPLCTKACLEVPFSLSYEKFNRLPTFLHKGVTILKISSGPALTDVFLKNLGLSCPHLEKLELDPLCSKGLYDKKASKALARLSTLKSLSLGGSALCTALPPELETLVLACPAPSLKNLLSPLRNLQSLTLTDQHTGFEGDQIQSLPSSFKAFKNLKYLKIKMAQFHTESFKALLHLLGPKLQSLDLKVRDANVLRALANYLKKENPPLEKLNLYLLEDVPADAENADSLRYLLSKVKSLSLRGHPNVLQLFPLEFETSVKTLDLTIVPAKSTRPGKPPEPTSEDTIYSLVRALEMKGVEYISLKNQDKNFFSKMEELIAHGNCQLAPSTLKSLEFEHTSEYQGTLKCLSWILNKIPLETFSFRSNFPLDEDFKRCVLNHPSLKAFKLKGSKLTTTDIEEFFSNPRFTSLHLTGTHITEGVRLNDPKKEDQIRATCPPTLEELNARPQKEVEEPTLYYSDRASLRGSDEGYKTRGNLQELERRGIAVKFED